MPSLLWIKPAASSGEKWERDAWGWARPGGSSGVPTPPASPILAWGGRAVKHGDGRKRKSAFRGLKQEDQQPIFNGSFECEVSPMLKKARGE